jgi:hypothetical protein
LLLGQNRKLESRKQKISQSQLSTFPSGSDGTKQKLRKQKAQISAFPVSNFQACHGFCFRLSAFQFQLSAFETGSRPWFISAFQFQLSAFETRPGSFLLFQFELSAFETRSLPTLPHRYPRDFTFYVTPPVAPFSFSGVSFLLSNFSFQLFSVSASQLFKAVAHHKAIFA